MKRKRRINDDEEDASSEESGDENDSSQSQQNGNEETRVIKKRKIQDNDDVLPSLGFPTQEKGIPEEEEEEEEEVGQERYIPPADKEEEEQHEDSYDEESVDNEVEKDYKKMNKPIVGTIMKIKLVNFMCHSAQTIEFGNHITVITGDNGSGKSAFVTALKICFGSMKNVRGNTRESVESYIKTGRNICEIEVTLRNHGADSYKNEKYGKSITICRHLIRGGSKSYKIKDHNGSVVGRGKSELENILSHFNIHISNPSVVMTQSESKQFLQGKPKDKYNMFLEASGLKDMLANLQGVNESKNIINESLKMKIGAIGDDKREVDRLEALVEYTNQIKEMDREMIILSSKRVWRAFLDVEARYKKCVEKRDEEKKKLDELQVKVDEARKIFNEKQTEDRNVSNELEISIRRKQDRNGTLQEYRRELIELVKDKSNCNSEKGDHERQIKNLERRIEKFEGRINELQNREAVDNTEEKKEITEKMTALKNDFEKMKLKFQEGKEKVRDFEDKIERKENEKRGIQNERDMIVQRIQKEREKIDRMKRQTNDRMDYFRREVKEILNIIRSTAQQYKEIPIGPLAMYLDVREPKWATACESALKHAMKSFIVSNDQDRKKLNSLLNRYKHRATVLRCDYKDRSYSNEQLAQRSPDMRYMTVLKQIVVDTKLVDEKGYKYKKNTLAPTIINCLIDNFVVEKTILHEDLDGATNQFFGRGNWPRGCAKVFCQKNGDALSVRKGNEVTETAFHRAQFWGVQGTDFKEQIRHVEKVIKRIRDTEEKDAMERYGVVKKEISAIEKEKNNLMKKQRDLKRKMDLNKRNFKALKYERKKLEENEDHDEDDAQIESFRNKITEMKMNIEHEKACIEKLQMRLVTYPPKEVDLEKKIDEIREEIDVLDNQHEELKNKAERINREFDEARNNKETYESDLLKVSMTHKLFSERTEVVKSNMSHLLRDAENTSIKKRIEVEETIEEIDMKMRETEKKIRLIQMENLGGKDIAEIKEEHSSKHRKYVNNLQNIRGGQVNHGMIENSIKDRFQSWRDLRKHYAYIASIGFGKAMARKNHSGELLFNHDKQELTSKVRLSKNEDSVQDVKQLSGGERSFSTVAMVCSLWNVCESPFRVLDEVDIFMDNVYRKKSLELLIDVAKEDSHKNRQLIIITPQTTKDIKRDDHVKVIKLRPPRGENGLRQQTMDEFE